MKYGEIKWKIDKVVFKAHDGVVTQHSETDEGKTHISKMPQPIININQATTPPHPG